MKKILILLSVCIITVGMIYAGNYLSKPYVVDISTSGETAIEEYLGRKTLILINGTTTQIIYVSTNPINSTNYKTVGCIPLMPNGGFYEDNYYVYKSTWYACTSTGTAELYLLEKE